MTSELTVTVNMFFIYILKEMNSGKENFKERVIFPDDEKDSVFIPTLIIEN